MFNWIKKQLKKFWKWLLSIFGIGVVVLALTVPYAAVSPVDNRAIGSDEIIEAGEESLFAEVDADGNVLRVIVVDAEVLNTGKWGDPKNWVRTYADGRMRYNYAGIGYKYDKVKNAFIPPKPSPDTERGVLEHVLNRNNYRWQEVK